MNARSCSCCPESVTALLLRLERGGQLHGRHGTLMDEQHPELERRDRTWRRRRQLGARALRSAQPRRARRTGASSTTRVRASRPRLPAWRGRPGARRRTHAERSVPWSPFRFCVFRDGNARQLRNAQPPAPDSDAAGPRLPTPVRPRRSRRPSVPASMPAPHGWSSCESPPAPPCAHREWRSR